LAAPFLFCGNCGRTTQPHLGEQVSINWANPLADGLRDFTVFVQGVGSPYNAVSGRFGSGLTNVTWKDNENADPGSFLELAGSQPHYDLGNRELRILPPYSIAVRGHADPELDIQTGETASTLNGIRAIFGTATIQVTHGDDLGTSSASHRRITWTGSFPGTVATFGVSIRRGDAVQIDGDLYIDGYLSSVSPAFAGSDSDGLAYNDTGQGLVGLSNGSHIGDYYCYGIWERELSPQEHADFAANPWQLLVGSLEATYDLTEGNPPILPFEHTGYTTKPSWGQQQSLDRSNPLAEQLYSFGIIVDGAGVPYDMAAERFCANLTNAAWKDDETGEVYLDFTSTFPHFDLNNPALLDIRPPMTFACLVSTQDTENVTALIQTQDFADTEVNQYGIQMDFRMDGATDELRLHLGSGLGTGGTQYRNMIWQNVVDALVDVQTMVGITMFKGVNTPVIADYYLDGVLGTVTGTAGGSATAYDPLDPVGNIVGRVGDSDQSAIGNFYLWAIWNRPLSPQEHAEFANNPWQLVRRGFSAPPALLGGPAIIAVPDGTLSLAGVTPKLAIGLAPTSGTLTLAGVQPQLLLSLIFAPPAGILTLAGAQVQLLFDQERTPTAGVLSLAGAQVALNQFFRTPSFGTLGLAGQPVSLSIGLRPGPGILTLAGQQALLPGAEINPAAGVLGLAGQQAIRTGPTNIRISQLLVEYLGSDGVPIKRQLNAHYNLDSDTAFVRHLDTAYQLPAVAPGTRQLNAHYNLPDIKFIPRFLNEQYDLKAYVPLTRQLNTDYEIPLFASVKRQLNDDYDLPIFAPATRHLDTDYDLPIFASRTRHFDAHYDLPGITPVIRQLGAEYNLNAFLPAFRSLDGHYDLQIFLDRTRQLDGHYDLQAALDQIRQLNEQYILPDGTGVTRQLQAEYILNAFLPRTRAFDGHYDLQVFQTLRRGLDAHYDLQAFLNFTRSLDAHYQLPDGLGFIRQLSDEYVLNAFLPVLRQLDGHYDLQAFQTIQRALDTAYDLQVFDAVTRQLGALYDLQAFVARKRLLNEEYDLPAFIEAQRLLDGHYDLQAFVGVTRHLDEEYDLQTFLERIRQLNGHYDLQAFQDAIRHLNGEYDLQVYAQLCRHLNEQYLLDAAQVFYTWLMNLTTNAPSRYEQFPFHSLARFNQEYFGARADGIYRLDAAKDRNDITGSHTGATNQATALVDSAATFVTNNIRIGEVITNDTDGSSATVVARLSETALTTSALTGGTDNDWDTGDTYTIEHLADIAAFADTGKLSLGTNRLKRVPQAFLGEDSDGTLKISFVTDNGNTHGPYNIRASATAIKAARAKFARGIKSRYWEFKLENKDGASLLLDKIQLEVEDYQSRVK